MAARKSNGRRAVAPEKVKQIGRYIVADPKICHGKLTFRGTRIMVSQVLEQVERGWAWDTIVDEWDGKIPPRGDCRGAATGAADLPGARHRVVCI